jgi:hypothetical protein
LRGFGSHWDLGGGEGDILFQGGRAHENGGPSDVNQLRGKSLSRQMALRDA